MIIIKGRSGKSRVLQDFINNKVENRSIAIIDTVGVKSLSVPKGVDHFNFVKYDSKGAISIFETNWFKDYDWIIFEVNVEEPYLKYFIELDRRFTHNFIVTVQTDDEEVEVKFI